ncbi:class I SAM-dependent methyltransferase [Aquirufa sp. OSTEICH-129A]
MYKFILDVYNSSSEYEQLKELPGTTDFPRAVISQKVLKNFLKNQEKRSSILEIGPGSGFITEHLSEVIINYKECDLDLMDFSSGFLENTKAKNFQIRDFICFDITKFQEKPEIKNVYDLIFFQEVLEHLVSPFTALVNINNMLNIGGQLFLTMPNSGWWRNVWTENCRTKLLLRENVYLDTHISEMSTTGVVKLVNMAGFDVVDINFYCSRMPFLKSISSEQVGFLLVKKSLPSERWKQLTLKNRNLYFSLMRDKKK